MSLAFKQKAHLVLRLAAARHLDDCVAPAGDAKLEKALRVARLRLSEAVTLIDDGLASEADVAQSLEEAADELERLISGKAAPARVQIDNAVSEIRFNAAGVRPGNGDGLVRGDEAAARNCRCGLLGLAGLVEGASLTSYIEATGLSTEWPPILFRTEVTPDDTRRLHPFRVGGEADSFAREITLTLKDGCLSAADLCQLVYVAFHELVCHGFQGAARPEKVANARPQCHWTEGWMDHVSYRLALASAGHGGGLHYWLPVTGPDAYSAMARIHDARFHEPVGLKPYDGKMRRAARKSLTELENAMRIAGFAASAQDAEGISTRFSLMANALGETKQLVRLSTGLQSVLLGRSGVGRTVELAAACLEFLEHKKLDRLIGDVLT